MKAFLILFYTLFFKAKVMALTPSIDHLVNLSADEKQRWQKEAMVARKVLIPDSAWPKTQILALIKARAIDAAGLFHALDQQKTYIPDMLRSRPIRYISATEIHTAYELKMPWPLSNDSYINGSVISMDKKGPKVRWYNVSSDSAKIIEGEALFIDLSPGLCLFSYSSTIVPKSFFAGVVKKLAFIKAQESVQEIIIFIEKNVRENNPIVKKYRQYFLRALEGIKVYSIDENLSKTKNLETSN